MKTLKTAMAVGGAAAVLAVAGGCESFNAAGIGSALSNVLGQTGGQALSIDTVAAGLKEALSVGTQNAVAQASKAGGFSADPKLHIPLPQELEGVAKTARKFGLGSLVDDMENKMNLAAEQAAAQAAPVFLDAVKQMTFEDAKKIWSGGDTAATDYFRGKTAAVLLARCRPIVAKYTEQAGAAKAYTLFAKKYNAIPLVEKPPFPSLDSYVTGKAVDGLFNVLGREEAKIRTDPAARTTALLRQVFGGK